LTPDRTILLDLPVATAAARTQQRGVVNHYDTEALGRRQRVRDGFLALAAHARASSGRIQVVDASLTPHAVERSVWASVQELL
jgi:dTMP kinase